MNPSHVFDSVCRLFSSGFGRRLCLKYLRATSPEFRALSDLFVDPYRQWILWQSGLEDAVYLLYGLTRALAPRTIVEIGSARGKSTCALALACRQNGTGKVYAIDPHTSNLWSDVDTGGTTEEFLRARLQEYGLAPWCDVMATTSQEAAKTWSLPIDLLFIDGDHTLEQVRHDFESFRPWLAKNALVVFHDTAWEHESQWEARADQPGYRPGMGVPEFMRQLDAAGYQSVTVAKLPGMTILDPAVGGFEFVTSHRSGRVSTIDG